MFRVLLPVDVDEDRGMDAAAVVATLPGDPGEIHVTILNVQEDIEVVDDSVVSSEDWYDEDELPASVERVREFLEDEGHTVEVRREHADPARSIVEVANDVDADRIVMASRGRTSVGKVLFGSVTQPVLLDADVPVTVVVD